MPWRHNRQACQWIIPIVLIVTSGWRRSIRTSIRSVSGRRVRTRLVASSGPDTRAVAAYTREAGAAGVTKTELGLEWPSTVFSLGHVALPFPADDPVYGIMPTALGREMPFNLGSIAVRGVSATG